MNTAKSVESLENTANFWEELYTREHFCDPKRPRMSMRGRAAQFAPYKTLGSESFLAVFGPTEGDDEPEYIWEEDEADSEPDAVAEGL